MHKVKFTIVLVWMILFTACSKSGSNLPGWIETTLPDQYGNTEGYKALEVNGYNLSRNIQEAMIQYYITEDMISGGYKPVFIITIDGKTSSEMVTIKAPDGKDYEFECYDGLIFNIDFESDNIQRLIPLFNNENLKILQGDNEFTINCKGFYEL